MVEVKNLYKSYGNKAFPVLQDIHMKVEKGTIHGLIGHNGSGKTTLLKCLTGIYPPDSGEVLIGGETVYEKPAVKEQIGYVADSNQYFASYRVKQLVKFYNQVYPKFSVNDFMLLNEIFHVNPESRIRHLSKGQQMRIAFMLNLAIKPKVMFLDEPTSGLDVMAKKELLDLLVTNVEENETTVIISSHHLSELEKVCDTMTVLKNGKVDAQSDLESLKSKIQKYQVVFPNGAPKELYQMEQVIRLSNVGSVYTVLCNPGELDFAEQMNRIGAVLAEPMKVDLEEVFVQMNKGGMVRAEQSDI